jgi:predicted transcriptional regulator
MSRDTLEIIRHILSTSKNGVKGRSHLDSMGSDELNDVYTFLVRRRLLERRHLVSGEDSYRITKRGEEFLREYEGLKTLSIELCKSYSGDIDSRVHSRLRRKMRNEL